MFSSVEKDVMLEDACGIVTYDATTCVIELDCDMVRVNECGVLEEAGIRESLRL
jgi:hypothetical protein